jgi:UDP-N-acetylmuramoyl-tripeptide--D-alanyl-D-alanine ligase
VFAEPQGFYETRCKFHWNGEDVSLTVPIPGAHMVSNALLAAVVGLEMGVSPQEITTAFENFTPPEGRLNIIEVEGKTIIDDVYNANPSSMFESLKVLCRRSAENSTRRRVAILGDMNELGHVAEPRHREVGEFAAQAGLDLLVAIGELSLHLYEGFRSANPEGKAVYFKTVAEFQLSLLQPNDMILVKASRGMKFEGIVQWICQ